METEMEMGTEIENEMETKTQNIQTNYYTKGNGWDVYEDDDADADQGIYRQWEREVDVDGDGGETRTLGFMSPDSLDSRNLGKEVGEQELEARDIEKLFLAGERCAWAGGNGGNGGNGDGSWQVPDVKMEDIDGLFGKMERGREEQKGNELGIRGLEEHEANGNGKAKRNKKRKGKEIGG